MDGVESASYSRGALSIFANDTAWCPSRGPVTTFPTFAVEFDCVGSMPEFTGRIFRYYGLSLVGMRMLVQRGAG